MKKFTCVTAFLLTIAATSIFAQDGIVITLEGSSTDISGGTHEMIAPDTAVFDVPFQIKNQTGNAKQWLISRYKVNVPTGWKDGLCWGHSTDPFGGTCYSSTQMAANPWTSSASQSALFTIADGEYGKMKPQIDPYNFTSAQAHFRYYVKEVGSNVYQDSVDLIIDFTASVNQIKDPVSVSIVPNPASDYIQISMAGIESAALKMVDVFGSTVLKENIGATKKLNVSDFNSGIYFLVFDVPGRKPFTRKVIIRN